jgi:pimeloyl-ACP methyl ester carboxylesterase
MFFIFLFILLTLAASGVYAIFACELSGARSRLAGRSQTIDTSFGLMEYAMIGDGEPSLIIHGAGGGFDQAVDTAGALAGRGYRLIAPSRFGYLGSPLPTDLGTAMQADAYAELLDRLGVSRAFVIAISAGA